MINELKEYRKNVENILKKYFEKAKKKDSAEFYLSLIKHANLSPLDDKNTLKNVKSLFDLVFGLMLSKSYSAEDKLRLILLIYCHFFEWSEMYNLFYDLSQISKGARAGSVIQSPTINKNKEKYWKELRTIIKGNITNERLQNAQALFNKIEAGPISVNKKIKIIAIKDREIGNMLKELFDNKLRNGFSHNNYSFNVQRGISIYDEVTKTTHFYSWDKTNNILNKTKDFAISLILIWTNYLKDLKNNHFKGKYCEYNINYGPDKRFKIAGIKGILPLGFYE